MLENLLAKSRTALEAKFGVKPHQLRAYLHYQPSFYHLHAHFVSMSYFPPGMWASCVSVLFFLPSGISLSLSLSLSCLSFVAFALQTTGMSVGRAHLLEDVIDNLRMDGGYYEKCNLSFTVGSNFPLYNIFFPPQEAGEAEEEDTSSRKRARTSEQWVSQSEGEC
jgi:m7GpppX diphosphatase